VADQAGREVCAENWAAHAWFSTRTIIVLPPASQVKRCAANSTESRRWSPGVRRPSACFPLPTARWGGPPTAARLTPAPDGPTGRDKASAAGDWLRRQIARVAPSGNGEGAHNRQCLDVRGLDTTGRVPDIARALSSGATQGAPSRARNSMRTRSIVRNAACICRAVPRTMGYRYSTAKLVKASTRRRNGQPLRRAEGSDRPAVRDHASLERRRPALAALP